MTLSPARGAAPRERFDRAVRLIAVTVLGFASGLPLALTGQAMQAWLSADGIDIATIGFLSLVGLPYTFKFLWAPLMDRFEPPWLGRRRGWLVLTPAGARRGAALDGVDAADELARRVRPPRLPGGDALGLAGRRRRRLPHRPAALGRARHRLVADGARLSAGDDPLRRHRLHLGRSAPGRRLDLARGLPRDGPVHGRRRGGLGAAGSASWSMRRGRPAWRATTWSASLPWWPRSASASSPPATPSRRWRASGCCRCSARGTARRRCASAGPTCWPCSPASPSPCRWSPGRRAGRASRPCSAA